MPETCPGLLSITYIRAKPSKHQAKHNAKQGQASQAKHAKQDMTEQSLCAYS